MVEFLTTMQVASTIETIIRKAKSDLIIVSPYLRISDIFLERLEDADDKNVPMKIIFGWFSHHSNKCNLSVIFLLHFIK